MFTLTTATKKIAKLKARIRCCQGGTSASKTVSILLLLIHYAQTDQTPTLTSIVSESLPHLKKGAMRDFKKILKTHNYWNENNWSVTDSTYTFETGSQIEFFGADQPDKLRGARRDRLFINECNNVPFESFQQLEVRTTDFVFLDWNPTTEFWFYTELLGKWEDLEHLILTYQDNEALDKRIVKSIEQRKSNKNWWRVYGQGLLGELEGRIYTGWKLIDEIPKAARLIKYGLDFGYTNDPTAIIAIYYYDNEYILDEITYQTALLNRDIASLIKQQAKAPVIADSAEPKSIDEIKGYGVKIFPAVKGQGSVLQGIQTLQSLNFSITKCSTNLIKEYRNYVWLTDKDGKNQNIPQDFNNHAMDAIRYALSKKQPKPKVTFI